jgi:hypothetical protein
MPWQGPQQTVGNWEEDFAKSPEDGLFANPPSFDPPIYNVWKQVADHPRPSRWRRSSCR